MAEALNATFFAFNKREKSGVMLRAGIACVVGVALLGAIFVAINYPTIAPLAGWITALVQAGGDTTNLPDLQPPVGLPMMILSVFVFWFLLYVLIAAFEAACLRWLIRGEADKGVMGLTLGADTWRVYSTYWIWFLLNMGYSIVGGVARLAVTGIAAATAGPDAPVTIGVTVAGYLVYYAVMCWIAVRLAPGAATSIGRQRFSFFEAWAVTKGRFWSLFGAFFIVFVISFFVQMALIGVFAIVFFAALIPGAMQMSENSSPEQVVALFVTLFSPSNLAVFGVLYLMLLIAGIILYVAMYGINARAVIAAAEEDKIDGVNTPGLAKRFD